MSDQQETQSRTPQEIESDIEQTREELADTAAALAQKADVKARAHDKVDEVKSNVSDKVQDVKGTVTGKVDAAKSSAGDKTPESAAGAAQSFKSAASSAGDTAKQNPVPTAAIAAAVLGFALGYLVRKRN